MRFIRLYSLLIHLAARAPLTKICFVIDKDCIFRANGPPNPNDMGHYRGQGFVGFTVLSSFR